MILVIDNYDSFTYNLVQYIGPINSNVKVVRNDQFKLDDIKQAHIDIENRKILGPAVIIP